MSSQAPLRPPATLHGSSPPPRPASRPHASTSRLKSSPPASTRHHELQGATDASVQFRPVRITAADLSRDLACRFRCDGASIGPIPVLDLSSTGFAASAAPQLAIAPGSVLESFELWLDGRAIWTGEAVVVHGGAERLGGRFTSGLLDLHGLRVGATLEGRLAIHREQRASLPAEWRAAVADLRLLLEEVRAELEDIERAETHDPLRRGQEEARLFDALRAGWGSSFYEAIGRLHEMSEGLDKRGVDLGRSYASSMLAGPLMACPLHRRAIEKPLGYAGDYRMMELFFASELSGEGLFGRFLHSVMQNYSLGRAVVAREAVMRTAVRSAIESEGDGPVRVLALAAGPAMELRRLLEETTELHRPVHLILLDQDPSAHQTAHSNLTRILFERHHGLLPVTVQCLHFSVRQLIRPQTLEERHVVHQVLSDLDLVYSAGLYDYLPEPVALRLTQRLYARLRHGGRLLLGNLVEAPDSTWMMRYVLDWILRYRTDETMLRLAEGLAPAPVDVGIARDTTGQCIFLDVRKPALT
jgi:extracellular factor (EF) 3-hydroxypalmitic acid methyl ester biosynthesis protein